MIVTAKKAAFDHEKHFALFQKINPDVGVDCLINFVQRDEITIYDVYAEGFFLGIFLTRVDQHLNGSLELVIMHAAAVVNPSVPITSILSPIFSKVATDRNIKFIRVHSDTKGMDRILEHNNFKFLETVYRKAL